MNRDAVVLFTLSPAAEARRKPLGLGSGRARWVFAELISHLQQVAKGLSGVDLLVAAPPNAETRPNLIQRGETFGASLQFAIEDAFSLGYERVVVIGNDAPELSREYLERAFRALDSGRGRAAVLGPASDGGYALLGLTAPCADAFRDMPWGTPRVFELTREQLEGAGFAVFLEEVLADIDDARAFNHFLSRARRGSLVFFARRLACVLKPSTPSRARGSRRVALSLDASCVGLRAPPHAA